jgi:hypothetical protein
MQAGDWLRRGFSELDRNSRNREANFFRDLHLSGQETIKVVEAFERRERVVRLQGIQYLLNHLVERGVGKYVPSLEKHLGTVTGALSCEYSILQWNKFGDAIVIRRLPSV